MSIVAAQTLRVLAADDSAVMRGILRTLFQRHAEDKRSELLRMELVTVSRDGAECLQDVTQMNPDVLILDLEMPRMNGLDVLDQLRNTRPRLPVIMCSSHTEMGARATLDALARGAADYAMKPAGSATLRARLPLWRSSCCRGLQPLVQDDAEWNWRSDPTAMTGGF